MSRQDSGLSGFLNRLEAFFRKNPQRKNSRPEFQMPEVLETRQLLTADLSKVLYDTTMLDNGGAAQTTDSYFVAFNEPKDLQQLKAATGAVTVEPFELIPNSYTFTFNSAIDLQAAADKFDAISSLGYVYPNLPLERAVRFVPNDPLFPDQWHLNNTGQTGGIVGVDANVIEVWDNFTGKNVVIGIVDDGLQLSHPDLQANLAAGLHIDLVDGDADPSPNVAGDFHGTAVAGVAAGVGNNGIGVAGAAFEASLAGIRLLGANQTTTTEVAALGHAIQSISISNNSWGPIDIPVIATLPPQVAAAMQNATQTGRGGLGVIYTWAGGNGRGNGDYSNYDQYASSRFVIGVGAITDTGRQSSYSESGANLLISAYSSNPGIVTTDLVGNNGYNADPAQAGNPDPDGDLLPPDYTGTFGGTSSATPLVSGVIALMLEANPNLSYRDVMDILARTARRNDPSDFGWSQNGAGLWVNHKYGFGAIDAGAAVAAAQTHTTLGSLINENTPLVPVNLLVPDNTVNGLSIPIVADAQLTLEHVELVINATHADRGNLQVTLISPDGTRSNMALARTADTGADYVNFAFTSTRHWGEVSSGTWTVQVSDRINGVTGTLNSVQLRFFGTELPLVVTASPTTFAENAGLGAATGTVFRSATSDLTQSLVVTLSSSDITEATVAPSVIIPAGRRSATFAINAVDDTLLDGTQNARITASIPGFSASVDLTVLDREEVTIDISPSAVNENAGDGAATVTVRRSNTDTSPPANIVVVANELRRYDSNGVQVGASVTIPWPTGVRPAGQDAHDVAIMENGRIAVFNGTRQAFLSVYTPGINFWNHISLQDLSASTTDPGVGGLTTTGNYVFLTDLEDGVGNLFGLVRVDVISGAVTRFGTKSFGNRLFGSSWPGSEISELDPMTGAVIRQFNTPATSGGDAGLAFDGRNIWFMTEGTDSIYKIDADTGVLLETHVITLPGISGFEGLAWLNDRLYLLDPFIENDIIVYNPATRQVENRLLVDSVNAVTYGLNLDLSGGLAANPSRNSLYVSSTFSDRVYEIDAATGIVLPNGTGSLRAFDTGEYWDGGLAVLGDELYVSAYAGSNNEIRVLTLDGAFLRTIPQPFFFGLYALGGDGLPGLVNTTLRYRDNNLGLDGNLYALDVAGVTVGVFDPDTLEELNFFDLEVPVRAIAVAADGKIYGAADNGDVLEFDADGILLRAVPSGLGVLNDIEINVSGRMLISSVVGEISETTTALTTFSLFNTTGSDAFVSFGEHYTRNTAELVVTIANPDPTEVRVPLSVTIPAGSQEIMFPLDAIDDNIRDGLQLVTLTASATGYVSGTDSIGVVDVEGIVVDVIATEIRESAGAAATQVKISRSDIDGPYTSNAIQTFINPTIVNILDNGTTRSKITVPRQTSIISDVDVTVNFNHNWLGDLDVYLVSPAGTRVELFTDLSSNGKNMTNTILDDQAGPSILSGSAPFTGRFRPEESFQKLYREQSAGDWYLEVIDDNVGDVGRLLSWTLTLHTEGLSAANVTLETSAVDEAGFRTLVTIPVVIPANQTEVWVDLDAVDDNLLDGPQIVTVSATAVDIVDFDLGSDTLLVTDDEQMTFTVSRTNVSEAAGASALTGTLTRFNSDLSQPYTVSLTSSDTTELTVPNTVTIPANASSITFDIAAVDDALVDGGQLVIITASAPEYGPDMMVNVTVEDLEPSLVLSTNTPTVAENSVVMEVTVMRIDQSDLTQPLQVNLSVENVPAGGNATLIVPGTVQIPANVDSVSFFVTVVDDALLDGTQVAKITATGPSIGSGELLVNVTDVETVSVTIDKSSFLENAGGRAARGTVTRSNTNRTQPLVVTLTSSDTSELTVPAFVTIPAGAASVSFDVAAVNDPQLDGPQLVQVSAAATGYFGSSTSVTVLDHEPPVILTPGSNTTSPRPTVTWQPLSGAIRYEIQIANLSTGVSQLVYETVTSTSYTPVENLGIGRYRVWVRAVDSLEVAGFWSNPRDFKVETAPVITAPAVSGVLASSAFPEIAWTAVSDATRYELWVNNLTTGTARVITRTNLLTTSYRATETLGSGVYRAFVRAFNASSESGQWSAPYTFTVLAAPTIIQPTAGGTFDRTPTFTWSPISGSANYDLWVSSRTTNRIVIRNQNVTSTTFTAPTDLAIGDYTVWVRAQNGLVFSPWSAPRLFSIGTAPQITSPAAGPSATARPTFLWTSVTGTERYELWVTNVTTNTRTLYLTNLTTTSYTPASNLTSGNYRVWVRAVSTMGETTAWSSPVSFSVAASIGTEQDSPNTFGESVLTVLPTNADQKNSDDSETLRPVDVPVEIRRQDGPMVQPVSIAVRGQVAVVSEGEVEAFDAVMEAWDASEWWNAAQQSAAVGADQVSETATKNGRERQNS